MSIKQENLIPLSGDFLPGQRLTKIGGTFVPIGFGADKVPGTTVVKDIGKGLYYKCTSVGSTTWSGNKAFQNEDGTWSFEDAVTSGLTFTEIKPEKDKVYSFDALVEVKLWDGNTLLDEHTVFLLNKSLTDSSGNNIPVTNYGLTVSDTGIVCTENGYAEIPAYSLPESVMCDNKDWTFEIKLRCTDITQIPELSCGLFGYGDGSARFDVIVGSNVIAIGSYSLNMDYTFANTAWHLLKFTHDTNNNNILYFDDMSNSQNLSGKNIRSNTLYIGWDGSSADGVRHGYPFEIEYIRISDIVR